MSQAELKELKGFKEEKDLTAQSMHCEIVKRGVQLFVVLMFSEQNTGFIYLYWSSVVLELPVVQICDGDGHEPFKMSAAPSVSTCASQYFPTVDNTHIMN